MKTIKINKTYCVFPIDYLTNDGKTFTLNQLKKNKLQKKTIENLDELDVNPLKTKVDLGCGFFAQAEVYEYLYYYVYY